MLTRYHLLAAIALAAASRAPAVAQKPPAVKLPPAAQLIERSVQVTGGSQWQKVNTYDLKGTVSVPAQGAKGDFELEAKVPAKMFIRQKFAAGEAIEGFDGTIGWAKQGSAPAQNLTGSQFTAMKTQASLALRPGNWKQFYSGAETVGIAKVGKSDAYRVRLQPRDGDPETHYFDVKTGFEVRVDMVAATPQGKIPVEVYTTDYRAVNGVKIPFQLRQVLGPTELIMQVSSAKLNAAIPDSIFGRPK